MPSVPRYGGNQIEKQLAAPTKVGAETSLATFGGGDATNRVTAAAGDLVETVVKVKNDIDEVAALSAVNEMKRFKTERLWNTKDGALYTQGQNAFGVLEKYAPEFDKYGADAEKNLANENQRQIYRKYFSEERSDLDKVLSQHTFKEGDKFEDEQTSALISNYRNDAILNYTDPNKVRAALLGQEREITNHAKRRGLPGEWVKQKLLDAESKTHSGVIQGYLRGDDDITAKKYFDANADGFSADDKLAISKDIEESSLRRESQRQSDRIFAQNMDSMPGAVSEAKKIKDPKLRDEVLKRVQDNFAIKDKAEREDNERLHVAALNQIDQTKGDIAFEKINGWQRFSASDRASLERYARDKKVGVEPKTNWASYYDLMQLAQNPDVKEEFLQTNLMKYRADLADSEFKQLVGLQAGLRKGDSKSQKTLDGYRTDSAIVNDALAAAGFQTGRDAGTSDKESVAKFRRMVDDQIILEQDRTGKKVNNQDVQRIVDALMIKGKVKGSGWLWDDKKRAFELSAQEADKFLPEVPEEEKALIVDALKRNNKPVTDENIVKYFIKKMSKGNTSGR
jgi:hypothetical protein